MVVKIVWLWTVLHSPSPDHVCILLLTIKVQLEDLGGLDINVVVLDLVLLLQVFDLGEPVRLIDHDGHHVGLSDNPQTEERVVSIKRY